MSRIAECFAALKADNKTALVPYVTAGDPDKSVTVPLMHAMVDAGANLIELGVPFSDPMADGPVIQAASERALMHHVGMHDVLDMVREFRTRNQSTPVILMGYLNPIEVMGYEVFAKAAAEAGVDGILTVDLPPEEAHEFVDIMRGQQLDPIFLVAPTSTDDRIQTICEHSGGFVYYVSLKGVTGAATLQVDSVRDKLKQVKQHTSLPIGVGFGISDAKRAAEIGQIADAVVVGSAIVKRVAAHIDDAEAMRNDIADLLREMRSAMDAV